MGAGQRRVRFAESGWVIQGPPDLPKPGPPLYRRVTNVVTLTGVSMRSLLVAAAVLLPAPLLAQFPSVGAYKLEIHPVGQDATIPVTLTVTSLGDSTAIKLEQGPGSEIPVPSYAATRTGFTFSIAGQMTCDLVKGENGWDGLCSDTWEAPMFTAHVPLKPEAATPEK